MSKLILRELKDSDEQSFLNGVKDWDGESLEWYTFDWNPKISHSEHLKILKDNKEGKNLKENFVPATMLYGFVGSDIVGRVHIRHKLNENLVRRGGNFGYAVAPRFRGLGYAKEMVRQALPYIKQLGIEKAMVTCAEDNKASQKLLEGFGAQLDRKSFDEVDDEWIRHYWLKL